MALTRFAALPLLALIGCADGGSLLGTVLTDAGAVDTDDVGANDMEAELIEPDAPDAMDALGPFGAPTLVPGISPSDADTEDPTMTGDSLDLYFMSTRSGNDDIWVASRLTPQAGWGTPTPVSAVNTPVAEGSPGISFDGLTMWFCRSVVFGKPAIWVTTRASRSEGWSSPSPVDELNTEGSQVEPAVDETSLRMLFASNRAGTWEIYEASRENLQATWSAPKLVPELDIDPVDRDPFVGGLGLKVWFASGRTGSGDIYASERASALKPFAAPEAVTELNSPSVEADPTLSSDLRTILFASNRGGSMQIYQAVR